MQIESLSKRLDRKLFYKTSRGKVKVLTEGKLNIWRVVKRLPMDEWTSMSPAQATVKVIDPMLDTVAKTLNSWEGATVDELPVVEDDVVACFCCNDGAVPVRMLLCPSKEGDEIVIIVEILAEPPESA